MICMHSAIQLICVCNSPSDYFDSSDSRIFFNSHYSEIFYVFHDVFCMVEANLKTKGQYFLNKFYQTLAICTDIGHNIAVVWLRSAHFSLVVIEMTAFVHNSLYVDCSSGNELQSIKTDSVAITQNAPSLFSVYFYQATNHKEKTSIRFSSF